MDCFFAAIECRDDPSVADKPVGVGSDKGRGVLTTCNYIAREFGCHSAMPVFLAKKRCPHLVLKPIRFDVYKRESQRIREIFARYTDKIEPLSLDEAYLDVSHREEYAWDLAKTIRAEIFKTTGLTASAGIAANKMIAKIASDWRKPNGQFAVVPDQVEGFMKDLPVRKLWGVGPKSAERLASLGLDTCGQLQELSLDQAMTRFGPTWGYELHRLCRGIDDRDVQTERIRKSMSVEHTFSNDLTTLEDCEAELPEIVDELKADLAKAKLDDDFAKIFVKLKFSDFKTTTKERTGYDATITEFLPLLTEAFSRNDNAVRLIGVGVRFPTSAPQNFEQLELPLKLKKTRPL